MNEFPGALMIIVGLAAIGLYALLWRVSGSQSPAGKILLRLALPALLVFPVVVFLFLGTADRASSPSAGAPVEEMEGGSGAPKPALAKKRAEKPVEPESEPVGSAEPDETESETVGSAEPDVTESEPVGSAVPAESPSPPPPPARAPFDTTLAPSGSDSYAPGMASGSDDATRSLSLPVPVPAPAPAAGARADSGAAPPMDTETAAFSVVPVFFGTDRSRAADPKRLHFGLERARKLELGQALVSVPKSHEVPEVERPWSVKIPYFDVKIYEETEDPAKHFTMREMRSLTREEFLTVVRDRLKRSARFKDHAFIFVHGFNTTFDNAVYRTAQIAHDLKFDGAPFLYSWPSGGGVASYTYDRESSGQSEPFMRDFMELVVSQSGAKAVSVIAHSMGNQPVLQVLKDMRRLSPDVVIDQIILAAPDVDRDNFENIANEIKGLAKGITLYVAANDRALSVSRRFHGGIPRAGDVPTGGPLVLSGVDTIDVTGVSTDSLGINHSGYAENNALLNDIGLLLQTGERPPEKRIPILSKITTPKGDYWKYPVTP